jgi:hypothetical protein
MAAGRTHRFISNDLLAVAVGIKREADVTQDQIQAIVDRFAGLEQWQERTGGIGFPIVEDIPQNRRAEFLAALAALAPNPDRPSRDERILSASEIWRSRVSE